MMEQRDIERCRYAEEVIKNTNLYRCTLEFVCEDQMPIAGKRFCRKELRRKSVTTTK